MPLGLVQYFSETDMLTYIMYKYTYICSRSKRLVYITRIDKRTA